MAVYFLTQSHITLGNKQQNNIRRQQHQKTKKHGAAAHHLESIGPKESHKFIENPEIKCKI